MEDLYKAPLDRDLVRQLKIAFAEVSTAKQKWLVTRFPGCETDKEANELCGVTDGVIRGWKERDITFKAAYNLLKSGLIDWEKHLAYNIISGNALLGALENRKLIEIPWEECSSARIATAKSTAINQALDCTIGKKESYETTVTKMEDLLED